LIWGRWEGGEVDCEVNAAACLFVRVVKAKRFSISLAFHCITNCKLIDVHVGKFNFLNFFSVQRLTDFCNAGSPSCLRGNDMHLSLELLLPGRVFFYLNSISQVVGNYIIAMISSL